MASFLKENKAQQQAIETLNGPVIIVSCPGSGKTTTLIRRIHKLVESEVDPKKILMVTFAKAAANDMATRYRKMYGENPGVVFATIHKFCYVVLLQEEICTPDSLLGENEKREIIYRKILNYADINDIQEMITSVITELSVVKNNYVDMNTYVPQSCEKEVFLSIMSDYENEKAEVGKIDFDDMLIQCLELFHKKPAVLNKWKKRFEYIQCDEYQDTNCIQRDILYLLAGDKANLCVVGDDDQSIYRFRGADSSIMMGFENDFRTKNPKMIMMSTNYRSAQKIIDIADILIAFNTKRFPKDFVSNRGLDGEQGEVTYTVYGSKGEEAEKVAEKIKQLHNAGIPYDDIAILFRNNKQAAVPVQALAKLGIPYVSSDKIKTLYDDWIFEDIKAYVELSSGKNVYKNFARILNHPNRYLRFSTFVDPTTPGEIEYTTEHLLKSISYLKNKESWQFNAARENIFSLMNNFGPGKTTGDTTTEILFDRLTKGYGIKYQKHIKQSAKFRNQDEQDALDDLDELKKDALRYKQIKDWFCHAREVTMMVAKANQRNKNEDAVHLSTMHRSKGQEWKYVFMIGVNEGIIPSRSATTVEDYEEERRVLYVGMTRAKDTLMISCSGKNSKFMDEVLPLLKEKYEPTIKKKLAGSPVMHDKFGKGRIVSYTANQVTIRFDSELKKFKFPDTFREGHLKYV